MIGATTPSVALSVTGVGLIVVSISAEIACFLSLGTKVLHKLIINKLSKYEKLYEKDQQTNKSFDELYRKSLKGNVLDKIEYESLGIFFT